MNKYIGTALFVKEINLTQSCLSWCIFPNLRTYKWRDRSDQNHNFNHECSSVSVYPPTLRLGSLRLMVGMSDMISRDTGSARKNKVSIRRIPTTGWNSIKPSSWESLSTERQDALRSYRWLLLFICNVVTPFRSAVWIEDLLYPPQP